MRTDWIVTIMVVALLGAASAQGMGHTHGMTERQRPGDAQSAGMPGMGVPVAFDDEAGFLQHMILHHEEAVASAEQLLEVAEREELLELARDVIDAQRAEIETMEAWLEAWYPERTDEVAYEPMMRDLEGLAPEEAERAFLEGMIMHHMMAVRDARHLLAHGLAEHDEVEALARDIIADQMDEIEQMEAWLHEWFDVDAGMRMGGETMPGAGMMGGGMMGGGMMREGHVPEAESMQRMHEMMHGQLMRGRQGMHQRMAMRGMGMPGRGMHGSGMHGRAMHGQGMHGMRQMMPACMRMMGTMLGPMGMDAMPRGVHMAGDGPVVGLGEAGVEALARAFLAGREVDADIVGVEEPRNVYRVTYRDGELERVLLVDADTGEVTPEAAPE